MYYEMSVELLAYNAWHFGFPQNVAWEGFEPMRLFR